MKKPKTLLTSKQLKELIGVKSNTTLQSWIDKGVIPPPVISGVCTKRWDPVELDQWLSNNRESRP